MASLRMKSGAIAASGFVADGYWRYTRNEEFRARERVVRETVRAEFGPRLARADGWIERWRVCWERFLALHRALRGLRPSPHSCYARAADVHRGEPPADAR